MCKGDDVFMRVSWKLAFNYIKTNKKRTIIMASCILISTALITTILLLMDSYREYVISSERSKGNWEVRYNGITYEEAEIIEKHENVKEISVMSQVDEVSYEGINMPIAGYDKNALNSLIKNSLVEGRLPKNSNEIIVLDNNCKIGDKFYSSKEGVNKEYTVVGVIYYNNVIDSFQLITLLDRNTLKESSKVDITVISKNVKDIYNDYYNIYYKLKTYRNQNGSSLDRMTEYNKQLLEYEGVLDYVSDFQRDIYEVEGIFVGIVVISSMIFIYSVINISVIERKRYFGILKSIGTTTTQMKRSIRAELFIILLIAIPIGILIGVGLDYVLVTVINNMLPQFSTSFNIIFLSLLDANEEMKLAIPLSTIGSTILIMILTVYIAATVPIKKVSKIQTINMIRQNKENVRIKKGRKIKILEVKHIERSLAYKNIEKYKARYVSIIMSLLVSIMLIIASGYYIMNITQNLYKTDLNYAIAINYNKEKCGDLTEKIIDDIQEAGIAEKVIAFKNSSCSMIVDEENISDEEKEFSRKLFGGDYNLYGHYECVYAPDGKYEFESILDTYYIGTEMLILNDDIYYKYLNELGIDGLNDNECILVDFLNEKTKYYDGIRLTNYKDNDEILVKTSISLSDKKTEKEMKKNTAKLKIKKVTNKLPNELKDYMNIERGYDDKSPMIIGNKNLWNNIEQQMWGESYTEETTGDIICLKVNNIDEADLLARKIKEKYDLNDYDMSDYFNPNNDYSIISNEITKPEEMEKENLIRDIFIYSFIGIITLIGILNMYNAINSSLESRKREILRLITVGMEKRQINKMLLIENAICEILALLLGITFGLVVSYWLYFTNIDYAWYAFEVPWIAILISIVGMSAIMIIATIYLKKKIFEDDLMEILKREEI